MASEGWCGIVPLLGVIYRCFHWLCWVKISLGLESMALGVVTVSLCVGLGRDWDGFSA